MRYNTFEMGENIKIFNKTAPKNFNINEKLVAGIVLLGSEVKALREGHVDLNSSYVKIISGEAFLVNAKIFPYKFSRIENYQEDRSRKLLLHKKQIQAIKSKLETGNYTLVPISIFINRGNFKVEIALAKGKKGYEKRKDSKRAAIERVQERELKELI